MIVDLVSRDKRLHSGDCMYPEFIQIIFACTWSRATMTIIMITNNHYNAPLFEFYRQVRVVPNVLSCSFFSSSMVQQIEIWQLESLIFVISLVLHHRLDSFPGPSFLSYSYRHSCLPLHCHYFYGVGTFLKCDTFLVMNAVDFSQLSLFPFSRGQ